MTRSPRLWFATLGGMAAYVAHLVSSYWLVPPACAWGTRVPLYLATLVLLLVAGVATGLAVTMSRGHRAPRDGDEETAAGIAQRVRFMAAFGSLLGLLAVALILFGGAGILVFDPCQGTA